MALNNIQHAVTGLKVAIATVGSGLAVPKVDDLSISLPVAVSCAVFVAVCVWWLGRRFQKIEDKLDYLNKCMKELPCDECEPLQTFLSKRKRKQQQRDENE